MSCTSPRVVPRPSPVSVAFADDGCAIRLHGNSHPGDIDREKGPAIFPGQDAFGVDGLPAPSVETEDPIGLRDRVPALDIGELATMDLAVADIAMIEISPQRLHLFSGLCRTCSTFVNLSRHEFRRRRGKGWGDCCSAGFIKIRLDFLT